MAKKRLMTPFGTDTDVFNKRLYVVNFINICNAPELISGTLLLGDGKQSVNLMLLNSNAFLSASFFRQ